RSPTRHALYSAIPPSGENRLDSRPARCHDSTGARGIVHHNGTPHGEAPAMLEIEQKFARADFAAVERRLAERGAGPAEEHNEADHYFNAPDRDFARTDEAFRLRRVGRANFLTYKGPKRDPNVKIRTELEVPLPDGDQAAAQFTQLLTHLGYRPVAVVRKRRRSYPL